MLLAYLIFILCLFVFIIGYILWRQLIEVGPIYYPSKPKKIKTMLDLAKITSKDTVIDLGSGDGVILFEVAKRGAKAIGYEIDPILVQKTKKKVKALGLEKQITVYCKSMWKADLTPATVIALYLFPRFMNRLQKKIEKEVKKPIRVVSNDYQFSNKKYLKKKDKAFLYQFN